LERALDRVEDETGAIFESVFSVGYRRQPIDDVPHTGVRLRRRLRRGCGRGIKKLSNAIAKTNDVPQHVALAVNKELAVLGVLKSLAKDSVSEKVSADTTPTSPAPVALVAARLVEALR
jgi:hypothetical protein